MGEWLRVLGGLREFSGFPAHIQWAGNSQLPVPPVIGELFRALFRPLRELHAHETHTAKQARAHAHAHRHTATNKIKINRIK